MVATLLDHFHVRMDDLARLTDRQIIELYYHPREKDGAIEVQEPVKAAEAEEAPTLESELRSLNILAGAFHIKPEVVDAARQKLREKYAGKQEGV